MPSTSILPLEIEETILDLLAEDDDDNHSALKACSLVCQAFLPIGRKHIFGSIVLNDDDAISSLTTHAFARLLCETPEIADYICKLDYTIEIADLTSPSIQESLKRISRLEFLSIHHYILNFDWSNNPIRPALLHLLHLPTLTHFKISNIKNVVASHLIPCVNLKYLDIGFHTTGATETTFPAALPEKSIQLNEFVAAFGTAGAITTLCTARRPDGQPVIDFGSLSKITVFLQMPKGGEALQELFRRCQLLTDVDISFWDAQNLRPNLADLLLPSMQTLKHLVVNIHLENVEAHDDPLCGIPSELEDMGTKNIIESITIVIKVHWSCSRGDSWGRLDEVLTTPGWFALKRVSLAIKMNTYSTSDDEEGSLRKLPKTQFPRLSTSNSVSFDFEVT